MNKRILFAFPVLILFLGGLAWLSAWPVRTVLPPAAMQATTPAIGAVSATPNLITVNTPSPVLVTAQITELTVIPNGVNLLRLNANGTSSILGTMHDDGLNGDGVANDRTFSLRTNFNEPTAGQIQLQVSAAFRGVLRRVVSNQIPLEVWNVFSDSTLGISIQYPILRADVQPIVLSLRGASTIDFQIRQPDGRFSSFLAVTIISNPSHLSLQQWFDAFRDPDRLLSNNAVFTMQTLSNGSQALFLTGSIPFEYADQYGPVPSAYVLSKDGLRIASVMESQEDQLYSYGYTTDQISDLLASIAQTIDF